MILDLAALLPSGLRDPKSKEKLNKEFDELLAELVKGDKIGALLEAADNLYYCEKAKHNKLITAAEAEKHMTRVAQVSGFTEAQIFAACIAKYTLRARPGNPKNDTEERAAIQKLLKSKP